MQRILMTTAFAMTALSLSGCQTLEGWGGDSLRTEPVVRSAHEPGCEGDRCANVNAAYLRFPGDAELSRVLEQRLFSLASGLSDEPNVSQADDFEAFANEVFAASREAHQDAPSLPPYEADLKAKVIADHDDLLVLELDGYLFSGGAHGLPLTEYLVIDRDTRQPVDLDDMLLPGKRPAYEAALARAHQRWLSSDQARGLSQEQWPFSVSDNAAPLEADLAVKYQVYDLAPYATGQPLLTIPYGDLDGVFQSRYLP